MDFNVIRDSVIGAILGVGFMFLVSMIWYVFFKPTFHKVIGKIMTKKTWEMVRGIIGLAILIYVFFFLF